MKNNSLMELIKKNKVMTGVIGCVLILLVILGCYYNKNFTSVGILDNIKNRDGYLLNIKDQSLTVKFFIKPEWIPFESEDRVNIKVDLTELHDTTIFLNTVWNRGNDLYFDFDTIYDLDYRQGEFLYNGVFNEDGTFSSSFGIDALVVYSKDNNEILVGQKGMGPKSSFGFGINPEYYDDIKDGFYVEYSDFYVYEYVKE